MSKLLVDLLGADEREFRRLISRLELASLQPAVDIRLTAEIVAKTREKMQQLGLDTNDTTPKELFYALKNRLIEDDNAFRQKLEITTRTTSEQLTAILATVATKLSSKEYALSLSSAGTKRVLMAVPPRKTLKALKLRSLESVLKREDPRLLYALATQLEDESWHSQVQAKIRRLPTKDIGWHQVAALSMNEAWFERCKTKLIEHGLQLVCADVGIVLLLPVSLMKKPGMVTLAAGFTLQALQRMSINSTPYRRQGFVQGYHHAMPEIVSGFEPLLLSIHGITPSWRVVHELLAKGHLDEHLPDMEFVLSDMDWTTTETKLASVASNFAFWVDAHYLGMVSKEGVISFHLLDVAAASIRDLQFGDHTSAHFRSSLWNELCARYLQQKALSKSLIKQLLTANDGML